MKEKKEKVYKSTNLKFNKHDYDLLVFVCESDRRSFQDELMALVEDRYSVIMRDRASLGISTPTGAAVPPPAPTGDALGEGIESHSQPRDESRTTHASRKDAGKPTRRIG